MRAMTLMALMLLLLASGAWASPRTTCTSRYDAQFQRVVTTCTDGSRAVSRYDAQFQRWRTDVVQPGAADKAKPRR